MSTASTSFKARTCTSQPESHFEQRIPGAVLFQTHFVLFVDGDKDLRKGDVLSRVEVEDQFLVREHLVVDQDSLSGENAAQHLHSSRPGPARSGLCSVRFLTGSQIVVSIGEDALALAKPGSSTSQCSWGPKLSHFEGRSALVINPNVILDRWH